MSIPSGVCGAAILAGGRSSRMGCCKARLVIGGETVLAHLAAQLSEFDELLLSTNDPALAEGLPVRAVKDIFPGAGPLGGLHACLSAAKSGALLVVACDLPNYSAAVGRLLLSRLPECGGAVVCRDGTGRTHPLCGVYRKRVLPALERQLEQREFRVKRFLMGLDCAYLDTGAFLPDSVFFNMNTPEAYRRIAAERRRGTGGT